MLDIIQIFKFACSTLCGIRFSGHCRQLADVTKDGALSLEEFNTAMHLVVLRRNNIDLPDTLPPSLVPPRQGQVPVSTAEPPSREESPPSLSPPTGEPAAPPRSKEVCK